MALRPQRCSRPSSLVEVNSALKPRIYEEFHGGDRKSPPWILISSVPSGQRGARHDRLKILGIEERFGRYEAFEGEVEVPRGFGVVAQCSSELKVIGRRWSELGGGDVFVEIGQRGLIALRFVIRQRLLERTTTRKT